MSYECLIYEEADGIATITLNRPDALNSFSPTQIAEIQDVWQQLRFNDDVACAIVTGAGPKAFSVGIDMNHLYPQPTSPLVIDDP
ncbi:MAG TPA: enoyl-CoA hydratase-related protein, partial [Ilumatobacteraceae bacterium]|nr:enoyl-CoA hydratase-related protein [Ilumatobacteraceae bacterium]